MTEEGIFGRFGGHTKMRTEVLGQHDFEVPIDKVEQLITAENVYVCVQPDNSFYKVDFTLTNTENWIPFSTIADSVSKEPSQLPQKTQNSSIQPILINYPISPSVNIKGFEEDLFLALKHNTEELRIQQSMDRRNTDSPIPQHTNWNTKIAEFIRTDLLILLETFSYKLQPLTVHSIESETFKNQAIIDLWRFKNQLIEAIGPQRSFYGVPLKFNHFDISRIWSEVKDTEFYDRVQEDTELVLAVSAFEYPGSLFSVWVFVGCVSTEKGY